MIQIDFDGVKLIYLCCAEQQQALKNLIMFMRQVSWEFSQTTDFGIAEQGRSRIFMYLVQSAFCTVLQGVLKLLELLFVEK